MKIFDKKLIVNVFLIIFISVSVYSQSVQNITGKWTFKELLNKDEIDGIALAQLEDSNIMENMVIELGENGSYNAFIMGTATKGKWVKTKNVLQLNSPVMPIEFLILRATEFELALKINDAEFLMEKK